MKSPPVITVNSGDLEGCSYILGSAHSGVIRLKLESIIKATHIPINTGLMLCCHKGLTHNQTNTDETMSCSYPEETPRMSSLKVKSVILGSA